MNRARLRLAAAVLTPAVLLSACTGSHAVDQIQSNTYTFTSGTALGQLYPVADRKKAGSFTADLLNGGTISSAAMAGKITVLNFWAEWCIPCRTETPQFDLLYRKIKNQGVDFLGIDTKDGKSAAQSFVKNFDISYPIAFDEQGETALRLGKVPQASLPFTVLLDKQGRVAAVYLLALSAIDLQRAIGKLQAET